MDFMKFYMKFFIYDFYLERPYMARESGLNFQFTTIVVKKSSEMTQFHTPLESYIIYIIYRKYRVVVD